MWFVLVLAPKGVHHSSAHHERKESKEGEFVMHSGLGVATVCFTRFC